MKSIWSGSIGFGLVNIPINLYSGSRSRTIDLDYLRKSDHCPVGYARVCKQTGEEVAYEDIVRGFEYKKGEYVILTEDDFKKASVKKSELIEVLDFVDANSIDPKYFVRPYFVEPAKGAVKAYALLREAMKKSKKAAIARFVMREKEYLALIQPDENMLTLIIMRFESEIRSPVNLAIPKETKIRKEELATAIQIIEGLTKPFDSADYVDTYNIEIKRIISHKAKGKLIEVPMAEKVEPTEVKDLMAKLKESLRSEYMKKSRHYVREQ